MQYYIKDWFANLKNCSQFSQNESNQLKEQPTIEIRPGTESDPIHSEEASLNEPILNKNSLYKPDHGSFPSVYLFTVTICFISIYLTNHIVLNDKLNGLLFLLSTLIVLTCLIFYYPVYLLNVSGFINLRILKWIYTILGISVFFYLLRSHIQACSSLILSASLGIKIFRELPFTFPNTFTYNELIFIVTIIANTVFTFIMNISNIISNQFSEVIVVQQALIWLLLTISLTSNFKPARTSTICFLACSVVLLVVQFIPMTRFLLNQDPFLWLLNFLFFTDSKRVHILVYWSLAFLSLGFILILQKLIFSNKKLEKAVKIRERLLTTIRKTFHFLICVVYSLGFAYDRHLLYLCSYGMFILLILIETIRYHKIGKIGEIINSTMIMFVDEKDSNSKLILSHIYLLVGFSFPFWASNFDELSVSQFSGLITVGIGDSFASIVGSRWGKHKLPGCTKKSLEGSLAMMLSEFLIFFILVHFEVFDILNAKNAILIQITVVSTCFIEAYTKDNDNFILPIVAYPLLRLLNV